MIKWTHLLLLTTLFFPGFSFAQAEQVSAAAQKAVLITGASRGLGLKTTEHLTAAGYFVFAGARKDEDMKKLNSMKNVKAVRLDVTIPEQVEAAVATIKAHGLGLYGLVNNAGIGNPTPLLETDEETFDKLMQVNVYGPYRVSKAFAPLIIEQQGRIVNIGSVAGLAAGPQWGAYSTSKAALETITETLHASLKKQGAWAIIVEPGNYSIFSGADPLDVAKSVEHALFSPTPKRRYLTVSQEKESKMAINATINRLVQLDQDHPFSLGTEQIIKMINFRTKKLAAE